MLCGLTNPSLLTDILDSFYKKQYIALYGPITSDVPRKQICPLSNLEMGHDALSVQLLSQEET